MYSSTISWNWIVSFWTWILLIFTQMCHEAQAWAHIHPPCAWEHPFFANGNGLCEMTRFFEWLNDQIAFFLSFVCVSPELSFKRKILSCIFFKCLNLWIKWQYCFLWKKEKKKNTVLLFNFPDALMFNVKNKNFGYMDLWLCVDVVMAWRDSWCFVIHRFVFICISCHGMSGCLHRIFSDH